ncbi:hypothetical protein NJH78_05210 [Pseudomonas chlororaphis]|uniref:phage baseplate assembly protein n=1 Tax=Pseudomonas chlororaphis TaxID=587753 RepID=UPI00209AB60B|nr:hypothetical protein [Pseudomonas chlororaphis]MCO7569364.1 hypothetical protein [Pseudomonas chlororaphis]MCO7586791.1 hypothetical protein [Pseudomonas chlororaphis]
MDTDDLIITSGAQSVSGWTDIRVTRGIERLPSDFSIGMTERYTGELADVLLKAGDPCAVRLGDDLVITGYVDHNVPSISAGDHSIRIVGRSKCSDLVDCAAEWPGSQISSSTVVGVAQRLASVYGPRKNGVPEGVKVATDIKDADNPPLPIIPQTNLMLGESPFEIIDRMARFSSALVYDLPDGSLFITRAGKKLAASGFVEGQNVQSAYADNSADICYSDYDVYISSVDVFTDMGEQGNQITKIKDDKVTRHRRMVIISEGGGKGNDIAAQRGDWEKARRRGRSQIVKIVTDSWRDASGALWEPNTIVPVSLPRLGIEAVELLISEVTYLRNDITGTTAELTLMSPEAFTPQPINLAPQYGDIPQVSQ